MTGCNLLDFGKPARQNGKRLPCERLMAENDRLRERITTQKQTIQAYRDESREWREVAERVQAENEKLRELCVKALEWLRWAGGITCPPEVPDEFADELRELGVEVTA